MRKFSTVFLFVGLLCLYTLLSLQNAAGSLMMFTKPVGILTACYGLFVLFKYKLFPAQVFPELWLYGLYIVFACVPGLLGALSRERHLDMAIRLAQGVGIVVAVYALLGLTRSPKLFLWVLIGGGVLFGAYGLITGTLTYYRVYRQTIGGINSNLFARIPLFGAIACLGMTAHENTWKRLLYLIPLALFVYMLFVSGSRTAYIALAVGIIVFLIVSGRKKELRSFYLKVLLPVCAGALVLGAVILCIRNPYQLRSFATRIRTFFTDSNGSASMRLSAIKEAMRQFCSRPVFGIGAYQFALLSEEATGQLLNHCHCDPAELLMAFGVFGTAFYVMSGYYGARGVVRMLRAGREDLGFVSALAGLFAAYLLLGMGDITIYEMNCQYVWGVLTACGMLNRLNGTEI